MNISVHAKAAKNINNVAIFIFNVKISLNNKKKNVIKAPITGGKANIALILIVSKKSINFSLNFIMIKI